MCQKMFQGVSRCQKVFKVSEGFPRWQKVFQGGIRCPEGVLRCPKVSEGVPRCQKVFQGGRRCPEGVLKGA
jgi:hypothetical protein